jgi:hypothetical protein
MEAMHYAVKDLSVNGLHVAEAAKIVSDAALARTCVMLVQAHGRHLFEANDLFANMKQLVHDYFTTPSQPTEPAAEPEKPVRPEIVPDHPPLRAAYTVSNDSPEMMISTLPIQEEPKKPRTPADILYPKRAS